MLLVTLIIWFIFPVMISVYSFMLKSNKQILARQKAIQQWYEFFEKLNILMQDYTVDYEEYYNRQMVWCVEWWWTGANFTWNIWTWWYCTKFTAYWNENSTNKRNWWSGSYHDIYHCTSSYLNFHRVNTSSECPVNVWRDTCGVYGDKQSYWQYKAFFTDVGENKCSTIDDEDLWKTMNPNIQAIRDSNNIQELYLLSHDGKNRLYFRRKLVAQTNGYAQYKIQMMRLRWFDAGRAHNFSDSEWLYDGQIDTRACDTSMWFIWTWASIEWAYSEYRLPGSPDDCWIDLTYWSTSVYTWKITISPLWDSDLYRAEGDRQINPYMKIFMVNGVYFPTFSNDMSIGSSIESFKVPLETTINMKDFYRW